MSKEIIISVALFGVVCASPGHTQSRLAMNVGGGVSTPLNPTGAYTGVSGNFLFGAGYNIDKKNSITGEFMWSGLPTDLTTIHPIDSPTGNINLYSLTVNYRHHIDSIKGSVFGVYAIGGGGWYYRYSTIDKNLTVPANTPCYPIYGWWGYPCDPNGYVYSQTVAYKGRSAGGLNGGVGFTIRLSDSGWMFYTEARYHYAFTQGIPTTLIPVTMGLRYH